jgi:hypothetical protein
VRWCQFLRWLAADGVPTEVIHSEDRCAKAWQDIEFALSHLLEAIAAGLSLTAADLLRKRDHEAELT